MWCIMRRIGTRAIERIQIETLAKLKYPEIAEHTVAGDVDAAHEPEVADGLVCVDMVAVGLDVATEVGVFALHRHQVQEL